MKCFLSFSHFGQRLPCIRDLRWRGTYVASETEIPVVVLDRAQRHQLHRYAVMEVRRLRLAVRSDDGIDVRLSHDVLVLALRKARRPINKQHVLLPSPGLLRSKYQETRGNHRGIKKVW